MSHGLLTDCFGEDQQTAGMQLVELFQVFSSQIRLVS